MAVSTVTPGPITFLKLDMDAPSFKWWVAVVVLIAGATQTFAGAVLGTPLYGQLRAFGIMLTPQFESVFIYVLIVLVLSWRSQGLMGKQVAAGH